MKKKFILIISKEIFFQTTQNRIEETSSKEILFGSGDGSPETDCNNTSSQSKDLIEKLRVYETREKELLKRIENERIVSQQSCEIIKEFEDILTNIIEERDQIIEHKDIALAHLTNIEYAFYDVTTKYERAKHICEQYRDNEQILKTALQNAELLLNHREKKYEILKKHANDKLMEANIELDKLRKTHAVEVAKLNAVIKKSECKVKCLEQQLEQKIAENSQMARLWEDLNNNIQNENYPSETL